MVRYKGMDLYGDYLKIRYRPFVTFFAFKRTVKIQGFDDSSKSLNYIIGREISPFRWSNIEPCNIRQKVQTINIIQALARFKN